jgi:hypothetical protein
MVSFEGYSNTSHGTSAAPKRSCAAPRSNERSFVLRGSPTVTKNAGVPRAIRFLMAHPRCRFAPSRPLCWMRSSSTHICGRSWVWVTSVKSDVKDAKSSSRRDVYSRIIPVEECLNPRRGSGVTLHRSDALLRCRMHAPCTATLTGYSDSCRCFVSTIRSMQARSRTRY